MSNGYEVTVNIPPITLTVWAGSMRGAESLACDMIGLAGFKHYATLSSRDVTDELLRAGKASTDDLDPAVRPIPSPSTRTPGG